MNMWPGAWVIISSGLARPGGDLGRHAAASEDEHLPLLDGDRVAEIGPCQVLDAFGRWVTDVYRRAVGFGEVGGHLHRLDHLARIETTIGPRKRPAGVHSMLVMYISMLRPSSMCCTGTPAAKRATSKAKLQPQRKATKSSRQ